MDLVKIHERKKVMIASNAMHLRRDLVALAVRATGAANGGAILIVLNIVDGAHVPAAQRRKRRRIASNTCVKNGCVCEKYSTYGMRE